MTVNLSVSATTLWKDVLEALRPITLDVLDIAYGSAREVECQLSLASRPGYTSEESLAAVAVTADETCRVLNGLIRSLRNT